MYGNGAGTGTVVVRLLAGRQIRKVRHSVPAVYYEAEAGSSMQLPANARIEAPTIPATVTIFMACGWSRARESRNIAYLRVGYRVPIQQSLKLLFCATAEFIRNFAGARFRSIPPLPIIF